MRVLEPVFSIHMKSSKTRYDLQIRRLFAGFTISGPFVTSIDPTTSNTVIIGIESILTARLKELIDMILADSWSDYYFSASGPEFTVRSCVDINVFCTFLTDIVESYVEYYEELSTNISSYLDECVYHDCVTNCENTTHFECDCERCECELCVNGFDRNVLNICNIDPNTIFPGSFTEHYFDGECVYKNVRSIYPYCIS